MLEGQIAVVTGAGGSIGRALSIGLSRDGCTVVCIGRTADSLRETVALCPGRATSSVADLSVPGACLEAIEGAERSHGRIDILVNCAGQPGRGPFLETPFQAWREVIDVNLVAVAACCYQALPGMLARNHGRILNLGSRAARGRQPRTSAYSASKAALAALTSCLAAEIADQGATGVLINDLIPGPTTNARIQGQSPEAVYPFARQLLLLPAGGPSGRSFMGGTEIDLHAPPEARTVWNRIRGWLGSRA